MKWQEFRIQRDPFGYFDARVTKVLDFLVGRGTTTAPDYTVVDLGAVLKTNVLGVTYYATSAAATGAKWTNFFGKPGEIRFPILTFIFNALTKNLFPSPGLLKTIVGPSLFECRI